MAIPLRAVLARLPGELQAKVLRCPDSAAARVSTDTILEQLPRGSVRITLNELIQASPPGTFDAALGSYPNLVELPLHEILPRLKSSQLSRRPNQRRIEVPTDIAPIFGTKGEHLIPLLSPTLNRNRTASPHLTNAPASPASVNGFAARSEPPLVTPVRPPSLGTIVPTPRLGIPAVPVQPVARPSLAAVHGPAMPPGAAAPAQSQPATKNGVLQVPLETLIGQWPEAVRQEIAQHNLARCAVAIPIHDLEPELKRGKIVVTWKQVRAWLGPSAVRLVASAHDELGLELQLSAIVPLFLGQLKPARSQRLTTVAPSIPNLFSGPASTPAAAAGSAPAAANEGPAVEPAPAPVGEGSPVLQDLGRIFGQPEKRHWTPTEVVQRSTHLEGVAGVVIALQDGLLVASELPPDVNADAFAAFLPQMHSRITQCTKEISLGEPSRISLVLDQVPLLIVKAGKVFLAALGRAGHDLPESTLTAIAGQLAKQSK